jgi:hypothetical protein
MANNMNIQVMDVVELVDDEQFYFVFQVYKDYIELESFNGKCMVSKDLVINVWKATLNL